MPRLDWPKSLASVCVFVVALVAFGCREDALARASATFIEKHDYASLETISKALKPGTTRSDVLRLLGQPDYSPTEGRDYYSSDRKVSTADGRIVVVGLVVEYRDSAGAVSDRLQTMSLGPIEE